jgi:glycosyltransferase involved in cell wall biosynthesis
MDKQTSVTQETPLVSVIVPAYNAGRYIAESLQSIAAQRGDFRLEILVVDDGSSDDTADKVLSFPGVRLIRQENAGPSAARNRGIAASNGELVAFLDADDLWTEGKLAAQLAVFNAHPNLGLVFGDCQRFNESGSLSESFFKESGLDEAFWGDPERVIDPYDKLFLINYIPTGSALVRKGALRVSGTFDESMRYVEDMDLWFRIAMHFGIGYTTHLCQLKRQHTENVSNDTRVMDLGYLDVIDKQHRLYGKLIKQRRIPVAARTAYKYCIIGDGCERAGRKGEARRWYFKALMTAPSLRPLYYLTRTLWSGPGDRSA